MIKILFQGDSITDGARDRESFDSMGFAYPLLVNADLGMKNPGKYKFINRGISGNRIVDLYARMKSDILKLEPDVMSILIGINGVWLEATDGIGVEADKYYKIYDMLLEEVTAALPNLKIMIMEPFVLKTVMTANQWDFIRSETEKRAQSAKKLAEKYNLTFIPLQEDFDAMAEKTCVEDWSSDGVHPTMLGHALIRDKWIEAFSKL